MGCRRMLHAGPRITEAAAAFSSILLSLFLVFWELSTDTVCHCALAITAECTWQSRLTECDQAASPRVRGGEWGGYCRPLDQSFPWARPHGDHGDSLCHGVTVRCLLDRLAAWQRDTHPSQAHVQYRGPSGGSALRGYQGSQADNHIPAPLRPASVRVCVYTVAFPFPHLSRSGHDENVATTRLS